MIPRVPTLIQQYFATLHGAESVAESRTKSRSICWLHWLSKSRLLAPNVPLFEAYLHFVLYELITHLQLLNSSTLIWTPDCSSTPARYAVQYDNRKVDRPFFQRSTKLRLIALMGGFSDRKSDGEPGAKAVWRGFNQVSTAAETLHAFREGLANICIRT